MYRCAEWSDHSVQGRGVLVTPHGLPLFMFPSRFYIIWDGIARLCEENIAFHLAMPLSLLLIVQMPLYRYFQRIIDQRQGAHHASPVPSFIYC